MTEAIYNTLLFFGLCGEKMQLSQVIRTQRRTIAAMDASISDMEASINMLQECVKIQEVTIEGLAANHSALKSYISRKFTAKDVAE